MNALWRCFCLGLQGLRRLRLRVMTAVRLQTLPDQRLSGTGGRKACSTPRGSASSAPARYPRRGLEATATGPAPWLRLPSRVMPTRSSPTTRKRSELGMKPRCPQPLDPHGSRAPLRCSAAHRSLLRAKEASKVAARGRQRGAQGTSRPCTRRLLLHHGHHILRPQATRCSPAAPARSRGPTCSPRDPPAAQPYPHRTSLDPLAHLPGR